MAVGTPTEERAILPRPLRGPAWSVIALAVLVVGVLSERYAGGSAARWLDHRVQAVVGTSGPGRSATDAVIILGNEVAVVVLALLLAGVALALRRRRFAVLAIVGPGLTGVATTTLKPLIGRTFNGEFAFPSGHTGGATALGLVAALLVIRALRTAHATGATLVVVGTLVSGGTMALALIGSRDHYPTDTVGGFFVAVAVVLTSALVIDWTSDRLRSPGSGPPAVAP